MVFGLSTSWNAFRYENAKEPIFEIKKLDFQTVELSFNLTGAMVDEAATLVKDRQITVVSLHNFCPIPEGLERKEALPDCYSMAALDPQERETSLKFTKRTIDTAARLGARAVVLHSGRVQIPEHTRDLIDYYYRGLKGTKEYSRLQGKIVRERQERAKPYFENTLKSLDELGGYADKLNVGLGIETRFYYREIPSFEEIGIILDKFKNSNLFYWHDTGHAQLMENLGFLRHRDFLDAYADKMLGIHLHDITGCRDHQAPGKGEFDFGILKDYLNPDTIKIIEAHYPAQPGDLKESREFLEKALDGKT